MIVSVRFWRGCYGDVAVFPPPATLVRLGLTKSTHVFNLQPISLKGLINVVLVFQTRRGLFLGVVNRIRERDR